MPENRRSFWLRAARIAGAGALLAMVFVIQEYLMERSLSRVPWSWPHALLVEVLYWYLWAAFLPVISFLLRRFPCERPHLLRRVPLHLVASFALGLLFVVLYKLLSFPIDRAFGVPYTLRESLRHTLTTGFFTPFAVVFYWLLWFAIQSFDYRNRWHEREVQVTQLESQLMRSQLQALKMQLNPHFLFNTLHAISALMYRDPRAADRMIARLSDLLRTALHSTGQQEVALKDELDFLGGYLEIEQARLGDRLSVELDIDNGLLDMRVPNLILQPLVENAVRHGVAPRLSPGVITVRAAREGSRLVLQVRDNGPGPGAGPIREGIGLSNVRARLQGLYGADQRFSLREAPGGGLEVTLSLPLHDVAENVKEGGA